MPGTSPNAPDGAAPGIAPPRAGLLPGPSEPPGSREQASLPASPGEGRPQWRATQLSLAFIVCTLVALLAVPALVHRRTTSIRERVLDLVPTARDLTDDVERDVAVEAETQRLYGLTGDPAQIARFRAARTEEDAALARLRPIALRLGPDVLAGADSLARDAHSWQQALPGIGPTPQPAAVQDSLFRHAVLAARRLDAALGRATTRARRDVRGALDLETRLTIGLAALVLATVLLLTRLAQRMETLFRTEVGLRRQLQESAASRERLIRGFSHDLKNPLGVADGFAQLLEGGAITEPAAQREGLRRLRRALATALHLVDDLLDLARAEAGLLNVSWQCVDLAALVHEVAAQLAPQAAAAGLTLDVDVDDSLAHVRSDPLRVRQILDNLVSNAIKYAADGGSVALRAHRGGAGRPPAAGGPWAIVSVADRGPGIPPERQAWIFDEFTRLQPEAARGSGLGLAISLRLARALGGDLRLDSSPGAGSTFSLWLPRTDR